MQINSKLLKLQKTDSNYNPRVLLFESIKSNTLGYCSTVFMIFSLGGFFLTGYR
jgi:hypothetical protein